MSPKLKLSDSRKAVAGMLRYSQSIPTIPVARRMKLQEVADARSLLRTPPSWSTIFIRAYGLLTARFPELRRCWISWPTAHLYEHHESVCAVAVEREWQGERCVFFGRINNAEQRTLAFIQQYLRWLQDVDVWSVARYRMMLRFGRLPGFLKRLMLWHRLDLDGKRRIRHIGTFALTNYGMHGAESLHPVAPQTTVLTLGPLSPRGRMTVRVVYDHRVLDGAFVARCLKHLDEVLHTEIVAELRDASAQAKELENCTCAASLPSCA